jgi:hypothetical protein
MKLCRRVFFFFSTWRSTFNFPLVIFPKMTTSYWRGWTDGRGTDFARACWSERNLIPPFSPEKGIKRTARPSGPQHGTIRRATCSKGKGGSYNRQASKNITGNKRGNGRQFFFSHSRSMNSCHVMTRDERTNGAERMAGNGKVSLFFFLAFGFWLLGCSALAGRRKDNVSCVCCMYAV